ncbi:hypothetical protein K458DRAFT_67478 [Lentithecium fluviatile CBS 122367]|uniref:Uncharacterized protein n=1 Tax=Lentithecium fluviatile CBS 122367 TaxID=1168545 RepID=A0A6G1JL11_9PLEO|nr:hypothetical protein K458DRAFT_67478 [Lentithecium fluviatile CBS 122367]
MPAVLSLMSTPLQLASSGNVLGRWTGPFATASAATCAHGELCSCVLGEVACQTRSVLWALHLQALRLWNVSGFSQSAECHYFAGRAVRATPKP